MATYNMTIHKQNKVRNRRKQLAKQGGKTGGRGFYGHVTPVALIEPSGVFPAILKLSKAFLARNPKDNAIAQVIAKALKKKRAREAQARYRDKKRAGVVSPKPNPTPVKPPIKETKKEPKRTLVAV